VGRFVRLALLLSLGAVFPGGRAEAKIATPVVLTQAPRNDPFRGGGYDGARVVVVSPEGKVRVLSQGFHAACDPDLSFDGRRVVFAGKKSRQSPWAIWETGVDGGECRLVSQPASGCRSPVYLSSLFTLDSPRPWFTVLYVGGEDSRNEPGTALATSLYSVKLDGTERRRITFNPMGDLDPVQVLDGRVIYAGWRRGAQPVDAGRSGTVRPESCRCSLFAINIDGTDQEFYGGEQGQRVQRMPCSTEGGLVVFVETETALDEEGGQLAVVEERRPHHSYRRVPADPRFAYLYPSPLHGNTILASRRPREGKGNWSVVALDLDNGKAESVFESRSFDALQAKAVHSRPVPDGRSTVVNLDYDTGILYALNLYEADERFGPHLSPGSIQRVRLIEGVPSHLPHGQTGAAARLDCGRRLLGEAPVEKDGSLHLLVPADTPLELQALDAEGLALATCRWIWVKQKENRGCIGCHEDPELAPENLYPLAVQRPPNNLTLPPERRRSVAFREQVLPLLQTKCAAADCHGGKQTPLSFALTQDTAARKVYDTLLAPAGPEHQKPGSAGRVSSRAQTSLHIGAREDTHSPAQHGRYVDSGSARMSFLIWALFGRDMSRPWDQISGASRVHPKIKQMPPAGAAPLAEEERRLLVEWIDLGAAWEGPSPPIGAVARKPAKAKKADAVKAGGM
jgi:hypothetical protein